MSNIVSETALIRPNVFTQYLRRLIIQAQAISFPKLHHYSPHSETNLPTRKTILRSWVRVLLGQRVSNASIQKPRFARTMIGINNLYSNKRDCERNKLLNQQNIAFDMELTTLFQN